MPKQEFLSNDPLDAANKAKQLYRRLTGVDHADEVATSIGTSLCDYGIPKTISVFDTPDGPVTYEVTQGLKRTKIVVRYPKSLEPKVAE